MSAGEIISVLAEKGSFNARLLHFDFPVEVMDLLSLGPRAFFSMLTEEPSRLSLDAMINDRWRNDPLATCAYRGLTADERLEVHAIIGFVLHETTHKVDLLVSPFGMQYLALLIREYQLLQDYLPRALDHPQYIDALRVLPKLMQAPEGILKEGALRALWDELTEVVRKTLAWGDLGALRPAAADVAAGWDAFSPLSGDFFGSGEPIELVKVLNSFYSFRPEGAGNWYLRPMTIFEAKALANTMLYLLEISGSVDDIALYYRRVYLDHAEALEPDYLFLFDTLARMHGLSDFAAALDSGNVAGVRHLLIATAALGWFALQAPPVLPTDKGLGSAGGNPVLRLFAALHHVMDFFRKDNAAAGTTMADIFLSLECQDLFPALDQPTIGTALAACRDALRRLREQVAEIWNPSVRRHFSRVLDIMAPHFEGRTDSYRSFLGMPDNGNPRSFVKDEAEMELFYHDHAAADAYREWLGMRGAVLFAHPMPRADLVKRLDEHFMAKLMVVLCDGCQIGLHQYWVSRFVKEYTVVCPISGRRQTINIDDATHIVVPGAT